MRDPSAAYVKRLPNANRHQMIHRAAARSQPDLLARMLPGMINQRLPVGAGTVAARNDALGIHQQQSQPVDGLQQILTPRDHSLRDVRFRAGQQRVTVGLQTDQAFHRDQSARARNILNGNRGIRVSLGDFDELSRRQIDRATRLRVNDDLDRMVGEITAYRVHEQQHDDCDEPGLPAAMDAQESSRCLTDNAPMHRWPHYRILE